MDLEEQYDKIYRYCYFKLHDAQLAQDVTQETFLRYYRRGLRPDSKKELPYLYTIARNLCLDHFRRKTNASLEALGREPSHDPTEDWVEGLSFRAALARLPEEDRELLLLRYGNELSFSALSAITGLSRFALHRRLSGIVKRLEEEWKKEDSDR